MTSQIINTVEQLEALDREALLALWHPELDYGHIFLSAEELMDQSDPWNPAVHFVVIATGEQVRAARKALEDAS